MGQVDGGHGWDDVDYHHDHQHDYKKLWKKVQGGEFFTITAADLVAISSIAGAFSKFNFIWFHETLKKVQTNWV